MEAKGHNRKVKQPLRCGEGCLLAVQGSQRNLPVPLGEIQGREVDGLPNLLEQNIFLGHGIGVKLGLPKVAGVGQLSVWPLRPHWGNDVSGCPARTGGPPIALQGRGRGQGLLQAARTPPPGLILGGAS